MVTAICLPRLQPLAEDVSASGRPINFLPREKKYLIGTLERILSNKSSDKMKRRVSKAFSRRELNNNKAGFLTRHGLQASSPLEESREVTQEPHAKGEANRLRSS